MLSTRRQAPGGTPGTAGLRRRARTGARRVAQAFSRPVTYVVAPHPDDETLRLASYIPWLCARTQHPVVLVAVSDGGASRRAELKGWTPAYEREFRRSEQAAAWSALTAGAGHIVRLGLPDGGVQAEEVGRALKKLDRRGARWVVAAHPDDDHPDHRAVVEAVQGLGARTVRFSLGTLMSGEASVYRPTRSSEDQIQIAVAAYENFGRQSVKDEFSALRRLGYVSRVVSRSTEPAAAAPRPQPPAEPARAAASEPAPAATAEPSPPAPAPPIFVLGNQKSGSTAIASLLAECIGGKASLDVLYQTRTRLADLLGQEDAVATLAQRRPKVFAADVVKDNDVIFLLPSLLAAFPDAQVVFVVRDPRDNIRSILNRVDLPGSQADLTADQYDDLRERLPGWYPILTNAGMATGPRQYVEALADRWVRAAQAYVDAAEHLTLLRYEDFCADKRGSIEALARSLERPVVHDITGSQDRQFQPRGDREVTPAAFFGEDNLRRIEHTCRALMSRFGYPTTD